MITISMRTILDLSLDKPIVDMGVKVVHILMQMWELIGHFMFYR